MELREALAELESLGTEQNRNIYRRHGVTGDQFGVSFANLEALRKKIKKDHELAKGLWRSGNHDARVLATMVADPEIADNALLQAWANDLCAHTLCDLFSGFVEKTPHAKELAPGWAQDEGEWKSRTGWLLLARLAADDRLSDEDLGRWLLAATDTIHDAPNRVRDAMVMYVISVGILDEGWNARALDAARMIGKVDVDHGETGCKTPEAADYIKKTIARKGFVRKAVAKK